MYVPSFIIADVVPDCHVHESCSDDDTSCSRSAAIGSTKRKLLPTSFTTEMAQSRKRRRRKKKDKTVEQNTNSIDKDKVNRGSVHTTSLLTQPVSDGRTSTHIMTMLENSLQTNSATTCGGESSMDSGTFQLFVHIEGDSDGEKPTCVSKHRQEQVLESKQSQCEKVKMKRRQALRGGSAHYCNKRMRKRLLKNSGLCETKHHPSTELSNFLTSSTSVGAPQSKGVGKQGALYDEGHDNLKGKELRLSPTPPVDTGHHTTEVTQYEGSKTDREASLEKGRHRRRVTRENSRHRRMVVMRYRKGRRSTQVGQLLMQLNITQPYMYMYTIS